MSDDGTLVQRPDRVPGSWAIPGGASGGAQPLGMTVRERVAQELRHRILLGVMATGERVDLDALAAEFGTSRTPVREACLALANDNLVRLAPRSGITVLGITDSDLLDNFALMASLAGMAAGYAAERATADELRQIERDRDAVSSASASGGDVVHANYLFHRRVNQASHSPRVMALIAQVARLFPERFADVFPAQAECSLPEHAEVVDALVARDAERARAAMERHFLSAEGRLRAHLAGTDRRGEDGKGRADA